MEYCPRLVEEKKKEQLEEQILQLVSWTVDPIECQEAPVADRGEYGPRYDICQEIEAPVVYRGEDGQTQGFSIAAQERVYNNIAPQVPAYASGFCQEV